MHLFVAVPSHSGTIIMEGAQTLLAAQKIVLSRGGSFELRYSSGATISLIRNAIVGRFLESEADTLLMLDSDQGLESAAIERMIDINKSVVGCLYPRREYNWSKLQPAERGVDPALLVYRAMDFVGCLEADEAGRVSVINGFAKALHVGTGAMLVRREAFQQLASHFPELQGRGFGADAYPGLQENWGFFNPVDQEDGIPLSEDISFCRRWRETGGEIWADLASNSVHVGRHPFEGNYLAFVKALQP